MRHEESSPRLVKYAGQIGLQGNVIKLLPINTATSYTLSIDGKTIDEDECFVYRKSINYLELNAVNVKLEISN